MGVCTQSAGAPLFVQFQGDFEMESVSDGQDSCVSLDFVYGMCLIAFLCCV